MSMLSYTEHGSGKPVAALGTRYVVITKQRDRETCRGPWRSSIRGCTWRSALWVSWAHPTDMQLLELPLDFTFLAS